MTPFDFTAWLDGFREAVGDAPTPEQWRELLAMLDAVQHPVFPGSWVEPPWWLEPSLGINACAH